MKTRTIFKVITIILAGTLISACSPLDKFVSREKPLAFPYINKEGDFGIISTVKDKPLFTCDQASTKSDRVANTCKGPGHKDLTDLVKHNSGKNYVSALSPNSDVKVKGERTITIIRFVGSDCISIYDWTRGRWREICGH